MLGSTRENFIDLIIKLKWISFCVLLLIPRTLSLRKFYMEDNCNGKIDMEAAGIPAGRLSVTRRSEYRSSLTCQMTVLAPPDRRIIVVFRDMDIEWEPRCDDDFVSLHDGSDATSRTLRGIPKRLCGKIVPSGDFVTSGNALTIVFHSDIQTQDDGFEIIFTTFHKAKSCFVDELKCDNGRCISASLHCNGFNNCGDGSDECDIDTEIVVAIILSVFLLTVFAVGAILVYRKRKKKQFSQNEQALKAAIRTQTKLRKISGDVEIYPCDACTLKILSSEKKKRQSKKLREFEARTRDLVTTANKDNLRTDAETSVDGAKSGAGVPNPAYVEDEREDVGTEEMCRTVLRERYSCNACSYRASI